jgi:hypothetical protein
MTEMELYSGFAWAIPKAFGTALHSCRFEQGDVLYSDPSAYDAAKPGTRPTGFYIQVLDPPRTSRAVAGEGEAQRFFANWESPVRFEWMDYRKRAREERQASQGGLFTCLWKGDVSAFREDRRAGLARPKLLRDLQSQVSASTTAMVEHLGRENLSGRLGKPPASGNRLFATAFDQSSDASRVKVQSIERALGARFEICRREFLPADVGLDDAELFHPALRLLGIAIASEEDGEIENALRPVLYAGGKAGSGDGGRFHLARHGSLVPLH